MPDVADGPDVPILPRGLLTDDALPLYLATAARLWDDVLAGGARPGDRLPSERVLSHRYHVSRVTLRAALAELHRRGMVSSAPGQGWFVTEVGAAPTSSGHTVQGFADYAVQHGMSHHAQVLSARVRPATVAESETLRIGPGAAVFDLQRLRYLDGHVVVLERNRLPLEVCPALPSTDFTSASLYATLRSTDPPQLPRVAHYSVEARRPTAEEQRLLEVPEGLPMLVATQIAFNQDGRPLEYTAAVYRGDRYRFRASITD